MVTSKSQFKGSNGNELRGTLHKENMRVARSLLALEQLFTEGEQTYSDSIRATETGSSLVAISQLALRAHLPFITFERFYRFLLHTTATWTGDGR